MRILVTGASGFLGYYVARELEKHHEVMATFSTRHVEFDRAHTCALELRDPKACVECLEHFRPTRIVHCAALTKTDLCERDPALACALNPQGTRHLLEAARNLTPVPHFTHISTDLVFDGRQGRYKETDPTNPIMVYGKTKLQAELEVQESGLSHAILRCALMYGPLDPHRPSFLDWMLRGILEANATLFEDEYRTPLFVLDAARLITTVCREEAEGIFHCGGAERVSRWELGVQVAKTFGLEVSHIRKALLATTPLPAPRPADVSLDITKAKTQLGFKPTPLAQAMELVRDQRA